MFDPTLKPSTASGDKNIIIGIGASVEIPNEEIREAFKKALNPLTNPYILGECPWCDRLVGLQNIYEHGKFCNKRFNPFIAFRYLYRKLSGYYPKEQSK